MAATRHDRRRIGFTLIEMLAVVMLIGILMATLAPTRAGLSDAQVEAAAAEIEGALRHARDESLRRGGIYGVAVDTAAGRIRVFRADTTSDPPALVFDVPHPIDRKPWDVVLAERLATRRVRVAPDFSFFGACGAPNALVFRDGLASCGDPLAVVLNRATYTLGQGDAQRVVEVDGLTGRVWLP